MLSPAALPLIVLGALVLALGVHAEPGPFMRFAGGGRAVTDCMLVTDVAGVGASARAARCTDGDPACDLDGTLNGRCDLSVRVCLDDTSAPGCHPDVVTGAMLSSPPPLLASLAGALADLPMPVSAPETCTVPVTVPLPTRGRRPGRLKLLASASMASGHVDRDRLKLVCRPVRAPETFATLQRKIFDLSCASASCHGDAQAGGLGLRPETSFANLVGIAPTNPSALAAGLLRVAPGDPGRSFLLRKLAGPLGPGEGVPMPRVGTTLSPAKIDLITRWILAGAPADAPF